MRSKVAAEWIVLHEDGRSVQYIVAASNLMPSSTSYVIRRPGSGQKWCTGK